MATSVRCRSPPESSPQGRSKKVGDNPMASSTGIGSMGGCPFRTFSFVSVARKSLGVPGKVPDICGKYNTSLRHTSDLKLDDLSPLRRTAEFPQSIKSDTIFSKVLFPTPLGPITQATSPSCTTILPRSCAPVPIGTSKLRSKITSRFDGVDLTLTTSMPATPSSTRGCCSAACVFAPSCQRLRHMAGLRNCTIPHRVFLMMAPGCSRPRLSKRDLTVKKDKIPTADVVDAEIMKVMAI
mmetsp:Transcript_52537/g.125493  ORF Transcript_52537/g.125493 Transcript_52537/m.125493 type:complete len:239 (-) Transcript_52537:860-1576(-)